MTTLARPSAAAAPAAAPPPGVGRVALCDGGLCNRLNALLGALVLRQRFGGDWRISWPTNNWCGAALDDLFEPPLPHDAQGLSHYRDHTGALLLMQERQAEVPTGRLVLHAALPDAQAYAPLLQHPAGAVYFHNLLPAWAGPRELREALRALRPRAELLRRATAFCRTHRIDAEVTGLHIRKTDFGDRVDDQALFAEVAAAPDRRWFVCSDSAEVNQRFAALPQCAVFPKRSFPRKLQDGAAWLHWTTDAEGRAFPFNVDRPAEAVAEALVDLLILSRTRIRATSGSTFLATARLLQAAGAFDPTPATAATPAPIPTAGAPGRPDGDTPAMNAPLEARRFDLSQVDENEHLIPRPYGTLQTLNLDHLYRYAFAKGLCYGADVLDAAMGCGYSSLLLNCRSYTGVDIDPNMVAFANEVYLPMTRTGRYLQGSVLALPVADHSIDTYISFETIEHIQPGEVAQYFAEVKRVLRPGGRFVCSTPVYRGDRHGLLTKYHPFEFRYQQFEATLINNGFALQETLYQWPPHFTLEHVVPSFAQTQQAAPFLTVCVAQVAG